MRTLVALLALAATSRVVEHGCGGHPPPDDACAAVLCPALACVPAPCPAPAFTITVVDAATGAPLPPQDVTVTGGPTPFTCATAADGSTACSTIVAQTSPYEVVVSAAGHGSATATVTGPRPPVDQGPGACCPSCTCPVGGGVTVALPRA